MFRPQAGSGNSVVDIGDYVTFDAAAQILALAAKEIGPKPEGDGMSRKYEMLVHVREADPDRVDDIKEAAEAEWNFADWHPLSLEGEPPVFMAYAEDQLAGGEAEEEFADRLTVAIWRANGRYCEVEVRATYLEEIPFESYTRDEDDYQRLMEDAS